MLKKISNEIKGYVKIHISGYQGERFLNLCKHKEIEIWSLESRKDGYDLCISIKDFRKLKPILKKTRAHICVKEKCGLPFLFYRYRKRKVFFCGIFLSVLLIYMLSKFVWNIEIHGNLSITDDVLFDYLKTEQIYHGMKLSEVNCENISNNIRKDFSEIIWVSVSIEGTNVKIHVKENTDTFQVNKNEQEAAMNLVSSFDGIITEMITRSGLPLVKVGDTVKEGDLLVSGKLEVINDAGEVVREEYKEADADVWAECLVPYEDICSKTYDTKNYGDWKQKRYYIRIGNYEFGIGFWKPSDKNFEQVSEIVQLKLEDDYYLPIWIGSYAGTSYTLEKKAYSKEEQKQALEEKLKYACDKLQEEGSILLEKDLIVKEEPSLLRIKGYLKVKRQIGTKRKIIDL